MDDHPPTEAVAAALCVTTCMGYDHEGGRADKACGQEAEHALRALAADPAVREWAGHLVRQAVAEAHAEARGGMPCSRAAEVATECLLAALAPDEEST